MKKETVALILAGGQGSRLGKLTEHIAKPAVPFGGRYRIIDFALSNCTNSGIETVGILTQYKPLALTRHIGVGMAWDLDRLNAGITILSPQVKGKTGNWYEGTAHAVYENFEYIEEYDPEYLLILSGDHIYKMDYSLLIDYHKNHEADVTIAAMEVPWEDASRFGILNVDSERKIVEFEEKPAKPKSNLASMGIYVFSWKVLRDVMNYCTENKINVHDFGHNVLPYMLKAGKSIFAYPFVGYWRDVGTVASYWEANLDLINYQSELDLSDRKWVIYTKGNSLPPQYIGDSATIKKSFIANGSVIYGHVENSMIFPGVTIEKGAVVKDSVVMGLSKVGANSKITKSVVMENVEVPENKVIKADDENEVFVYAGEGK
ncbi:glucose-1-phosphate adenylyltransferase [Mycoplasmopsis agassizii]|uniref:Glucose-1-phosphate adenylyltransferase n=1 Tax=Mycoplasmopsis agassizii TaxID=33922 RepID=A0ABX4H6E8_9BACT|nr:glucose-1-phosphate adenylyltransferase [Mycoplasmopsis agassizii]PAF55433.1 glucose-1-phosphate adenylyltransferase [Mycoplasmopsis agassizii]SMC18414.1 glucose-1-phosphate adenylyltransferase [Mycoplasmopsis agassizii]